MLSWGKHDYWTPRPRPENPPAKKYRYGEYPTQVDPESKDWIDRYYVYPKMQSKAQYAMQKAFRKGFIHRSESCQLCGDSGRVNGHHESYLLPLLIIFVCDECHFEIHANKRYGRDHSSMCLPVVGIIVMECISNSTLDWPVSVIPEFIEHIPSEFPAYDL